MKNTKNVHAPALHTIWTPPYLITDNALTPYLDSLIEGYIKNDSNSIYKVRLRIRVIGFANDSIETFEVYPGLTAIPHIRYPHFTNDDYEKIENTLHHGSLRIELYLDATIVDSKDIPTLIAQSDITMIAGQHKGDIYKDYSDVLAWHVNSGADGIDNILAKLPIEVRTQRHPEKENIADRAIQIDQIVQALYETLLSLEFTFLATELVRFGDKEWIIQRVQKPGRVLTNTHRHINCLDAVILFASLLERIGIEPIIVLVFQHAVVGWKYQRMVLDVHNPNEVLSNCGLLDVSMLESKVEFDIARSSAEGYFVRSLTNFNEMSGPLTKFARIIDVTLSRIRLSQKHLTSSFIGVNNEIDSEIDREEYDDSISMQSVPIANTQLPNLKYDYQEFYGRDIELQKMKGWIEDFNKVICITGIGGIGKSALMINFAVQIKSMYEIVLWQTLENLPPVNEILGTILQDVSNHALDTNSLSSERYVTLILSYLTKKKCLILLDNFETIMDDDGSGTYQPGYRIFRQLLKAIAQEDHKSCVIFTSREKPSEIAELESLTMTKVKNLHLDGLLPPSGALLLKEKGLYAPDSHLYRLVQQYSGNPLILTVVPEMIREVFGGDVLAYLNEGFLLFGQLKDIIDEQFARLSLIEQSILIWLTIAREPTKIETLLLLLVVRVPKQDFLVAFRALRRKSLVYLSADGFFLPNVILQHLTGVIVEKLFSELANGDLQYFNHYSVLIPQAKDYIRQAQQRMILVPLTAKLLDHHRSTVGVNEQISFILSSLNRQSPPETGYAAGNLLNILLHINNSIRGYDFSRLSVWHAYIQGHAIHDIDFSQSDLAKSVFSGVFANILSIDSNSDGNLVAAGTIDGSVHVWQVPDGKEHLIIRAHSSWVRSVKFSKDGTILATGSHDRLIRVWDVATGQCSRTIAGHEGWVFSVDLHPTNMSVVSGSYDGKIKIWDINTGNCTRILDNHSASIWSVQFSPNGKYLASGSQDKTIRLWDVESGECLKVLHGHSNWVMSVAFSPNGEYLASGSHDETIRLWDVESGECLKVLHGHSSRVWSVAFSPDNKMLASGSDDKTVLVWDLTTYKRFRTLSGHRNQVRAVKFLNKATLISGGDDLTLRLWQYETARLIRILAGFANWVMSVAFSPNGEYLASSSHDETIRLWDVKSGECLKVLHGHSNWVMSVAFSPNGEYLASGSHDETIRLWDVESGECLKVLHGHSSRVWSVAFSPDNKMLASSGNEVRLWDCETGECITILTGHENRIWSVAFSPDGGLLVSSSDDGSIRLWDTYSKKCLHILHYNHSIWEVIFSPDQEELLFASGANDGSISLWKYDATNQEWKCVQTLSGHDDQVKSLAFAGDGKTLVSGSADLSVRVWDVYNGDCLNTFHGHDGWIWSIDMHPDGTMIASGAEDETIRLWSIGRQEELTNNNILVYPKPYKGINITRITGVTQAQRETLLHLGAVIDKQYR